MGRYGEKNVLCCQIAGPDNVCVQLQAAKQPPLGGLDEARSHIRTPAERFRVVDAAYDVVDEFLRDIVYGHEADGGGGGSPDVCQPRLHRAGMTRSPRGRTIAGVITTSLSKFSLLRSDAFGSRLGAFIALFFTTSLTFWDNLTTFQENSIAKNLKIIWREAEELAQDGGEPELRIGLRSKIHHHRCVPSQAFSRQLMMLWVGGPR